MKMQEDHLAMDQVLGQAGSGCWVGEWEKEAQEHSPGTTTIWGLVICFQNL